MKKSSFCTFIHVQDMQLADFRSSLVKKALNLFPSLTEKDLKPYLLHSKATSAYDAVTLLAKSIDIAFDPGGEICDDTAMVQVALEKVFLVILGKYIVFEVLYIDDGCDTFMCIYTKAFLCLSTYMKISV